MYGKRVVGSGGRGKKIIDQVLRGLGLVGLVVNVVAYTRFRKDNLRLCGTGLIRTQERRVMFNAIMNVDITQIDRVVFVAPC